MDRKKLAAQIADADLLLPEREHLLKRLSVASHEGVAAVVRDYEAAMEKRRAELLPSYRRRLGIPAPQNKMLVAYRTK